MTPKYALLALTLLPLLVLPNAAFAYCGVIQESASARTTEKAIYRAERAVYKQVRKLRKQNGGKLQLSEPEKTCVGGGVAIDEYGNQIVGRPRCTVTQPFCVNP